MGFSKVPNLHNFFSMQHYCRVFEDMCKYQLLNPKPQLSLRAARSLFNTAVSIIKTSANGVGICVEKKTWLCFPFSGKLI